MDTSTLSIRMFLKNFPDERLAALYAHTQDGKLSFHSCCCLVGSLTSDHPLQSRGGFDDNSHYLKAFDFPWSIQAESEFHGIGSNDEKRRERLLPILEDEINLRAKKREQVAAETGVSA